MPEIYEFHTPVPSDKERPPLMPEFYEVQTPALGRSSASAVRRPTKKGRR